MKEVRIQALVDTSKCAGCNTCIHVCPTMAFTQPSNRPIERQKLSPCIANCPLHNDVEGFVTFLHQGKWDEALRLLTATNPFPAVTGRVCTSPCEKGCVRGDFDASVSIRALERALADYGAQRGQGIFATADKRRERVAVVGSGPAGLSCAYHLSRLGFNVTVLEGEPEAGGALRYGIPSYRLPKDIVDQEVERLQKMGIGFRYQQRLGDNLKWKDLKNYDAIYMALGLQKSRELFSGYESAYVMSGLSFLEKINSGKKPEIGRRTLVVGGGNTAVDAARSALRLGSKPTLVYRRREEDMPAIRSELDELKAEHVELLMLALPIRLIYHEERLAEVVCIRMEPGEMETDGRRQSIPIPGSEFSIPADTLIYCVGETLDLQGIPTELILDGNKLAMDTLGRTTLPGVFAGGDMVTGAGTVTQALQSGRRGSALVADYLLAGHSFEESCEKTVVCARDMNFDYCDPIPRLVSPRISTKKAICGFNEIYKEASRKDVALETTRCLHCGIVPEFDSESCRGCDNCRSRCPSYAVTMKELDKPFVVGVAVEETIEEQVLEICLRAGFNPESIVCPCTETRAQEIAAAIVKGSRSLEEISKATGVRTGCTNACIVAIFRLLTAAGINLGASPHPHLWYPTLQTLWEIPESVIKNYQHRGFRFEEDKAVYENLTRAAKRNISKRHIIKDERE